MFAGSLQLKHHFFDAHSIEEPRRNRVLRKRFRDNVDSVNELNSVPQNTCSEETPLSKRRCFREPDKDESSYSTEALRDGNFFEGFFDTLSDDFCFEDFFDNLSDDICFEDFVNTPLDDSEPFGTHD